MSVLNDLASFSQNDVDVVTRRIIEESLNRYQPASLPQAELLAGQPGAGKTVLSEVLKDRFQGNAILINGDEYRRFHPNYRQLHEAYGVESISLTSAFSSAVTEALIEELSGRRFHLIIEGTGRTVEVPKKTASLLSAKGYEVSMSVIATRPAVSLISTVLRFYRMSESGMLPRATSITAHDKVVSALPENLDALNAVPEVSGIRIWTRGKELIYDSAESAVQPSQALREYWNRPWSLRERRDALDTLAQLRQAEARLRLGQGALIDGAEDRLRSELSASITGKARQSAGRNQPKRKNRGMER